MFKLTVCNPDESLTLKKLFKLAIAVLFVALTGCAEIPSQNTAFAKPGVTKEEAARDAYLCAAKNDRPYFTAQCMERKGYAIVPNDEA